MQPAERIFESKFVLDVMSSFHNGVKNVVGERERPKGALVLTGAAVSP